MNEIKFSLIWGFTHKNFLMCICLNVFSGEGIREKHLRRGHFILRLMIVCVLRKKI